MGDWYCKQDGLIAGPYDLSDLQYLAWRGKLRPGDSVRSGEQGDWVLAESVAGLFAVAQQRSAPQLVSAAVIEPSQEPIEPAMIQDVPVLAPHLPADSGDEHAAEPKPYRNKIIIAIVAAMLLLLMLYLLFRDTPVEVGPQLATSASQSNGSSGSGSGDLDTHGNSQAGENGDRAVPGDSGEKQVAQQEAAAPNQSEARQEVVDPTEMSNDQLIENDANQVGAPPEEETPNPVGFTIQKFVPQEHSDEESVLGGGQPSGPAVEMFEGRDPEKRAELVRSEGGNAASEDAVERGLKWLVNHQNKDGSWSLNRFMQSADCNQQCRHPGTQSDTAGTALALMPLLGAGYTHGTGKYRVNVRKGLDWLIEDQLENGSFKSLGVGNMYAHGQASIVLCEAYAMTNDKALRQPAQKAVDYICDAQHKAGGWRYGYRTPGDTSVMGWQILALKSAQSGKLKIPNDVFRRAHLYLDSAQADKAGGLYGYTPGAGGTPAMSSEGMLCRLYCGWDKRAGGIREGCLYLLQNMPDRRAPNMYYWYYATQVMHHRGGDPWKKWNRVMRDTLVETQETRGHQAGSWTPAGGHDAAGGRIYMTSLALCTLEVYYRHAAL